VVVESEFGVIKVNNDRLIKIEIFKENKNIFNTKINNVRYIFYSRILIK
jgi:hypothetical protein